MTRPLPTLVAVCLALSACTALTVRPQGPVDAVPRHFFEFPARHRGQLLRLGPLEVARVDIARPLVFTNRSERGVEELVVVDPRSVARLERLATGERVAVVFECTEGRPDRGNLLVGIERGATVPPPDDELP
jgi:hypothetical protein